MGITKEDKQHIFEEFGRDSNDTGSAAVQVAMISHRIKDLTEHLKKNKKDSGSKKGLYKMVAQRKKLLSYLARTDLEQCTQIRRKLGIRG